MRIQTIEVYLIFDQFCIVVDDNNKFSTIQNYRRTNIDEIIDFFLFWSFLINIVLFNESFVSTWKLC